MHWFRRSGVVAVIAVLNALGAAAAAPTAVLNYGTNATPKTWAPDTPMSNEWAHLFYEMLVSRDPTGANKLEVSPGLATSWEQTPASLTLHLRQGVMFHDGTPFNADAVKFNIEERIKTGGYSSGNLEAVRSIEVIDPFTVRFDLKTPNPFLLYQLAGTASGMGSPKAFGDGSIATRPVGTGPYAYSEDKSQPGGKIILEAFAHYWDPGQIKFSRIALTPVASPATRALGLQTHQFDMVRLDASMVPMVKKMRDMAVASWRATHIMVMFFDRQGVFGDRRVRQAMCYAFNMPEDVKLLGDGVASWPGQRFGAGQYGHADDAETYPYNPDKARQLLAEAGQKSISITLPISDEPNPTIEAMAHQAGDVGIEVKLVQMPLYEYLDEARSSKYPVYFGQMAVGDDPYSFYQTFAAPDGAFNYKHVEEPGLKEAVQSALKFDGLGPSESAWAEVDKRMAAEALDCGGYDLNQFIGYNTKLLKNVTGFVSLSATPYWRGIEPVGTK